MSPCTVYPLSSNNSARYEPSWPVTPVMSAVFATIPPSLLIASAAMFTDIPELERSAAKRHRSPFLLAQSEP
ncbi:hypothetical protein GCM10010284_17420 [Streptomyces rubiginosohelvolus]|uniref:Uncharacterized protein n=1 Tax=Streptomyces rubiginosohelvolus TaxID=67362 RepID=A0ABQ3BN63_9ACTN|nr:hypothetical protein GCM10010284_17420 [Streptomyces rubiginosohelvolus]GGZ47841.1 hypothetical protein GCM10010328_22930 [Streptomyces pluricolorescens]